MTNPNEQNQNTGAQKKNCEVCHQTFNSDRELQDHMQNAHSQRKQSGGQTGDRPGQGQQRQDKIA